MNRAKLNRRQSDIRSFVCETWVVLTLTDLSRQMSGLQESLVFKFQNQFFSSQRQSLFA